MVALAYAPERLDVAYREALAAAPVARPEHQIARLGERRDPKLRLHLGTMARVTAHDLRMLTKEVRARAALDPQEWIRTEAQIRGGRLLAYMSWVEHDGARYHVALISVYRPTGDTYPRVLVEKGGRLRSISDHRTLRQLVDIMLEDHCADAVYHAVISEDRAGEIPDHGLEGERILRELTTAAMESCEEYAMTPTQAAVYVVRMLLGDPWERAMRVARTRR